MTIIGNNSFFFFLFFQDLKDFKEAGVQVLAPDELVNYI